MVDITNIVLTAIKQGLPEIRVKSEYQTDVVETLPVITVSETSNTTHTSSIDSGGATHSSVAFEINIFTDGDTRQSDCRELRNKVDDIIMEQFGMRRDMSQPVPNYADMNVYRHILRYSCIIKDSDKTIYRR